MDNKEIMQHINAYEAGKAWPISEGAEDYLETLQEAGELVYSETMSSHRWYDDVFVVVSLGEVDGEPKLIGFTSAHTTGDDSASDIGWEFNADSICEVEKKTKTVEYYVKSIH